MGIFLELSIVICIASVLSLVMKSLKQPLIVGYIITGIISGHYFFNVVHSTDEIEAFSKIGIAILLFIIGLNLSPKVIKEIGGVSLFAGGAQIIATIVYGFIITRFFGFDILSSFFIATALSFSSTIITLKLLTDKGDLQRLYGKISIGFLLVQDIFASLLLILVSSFTNSGNVSLVTALGLLVVKGLGIVLFLALVTKFIMPRLSRAFASSQELLFLFSLSWGLGLASLFYTIGFSIEIGALAAGVTLSLTPFAAEIASRLKPLRDFFIVLFFIFLGAQMQLTSLQTILLPSIVLSIFVVFGKPLIVFMLMNILKHKRRTGYLTGISLGQISEFSFILLTLAFSFNYISKEALSIVTLISLISITVSTYSFLNADRLYPRISEWLHLFEFRKKSPQESETKSEMYDIVLFGFDKAGRDFISVFNKLNKKFVVIDFNPDAIKEMEEKIIPHMYGDAEDVEFLQELGLERTQLCISTIPDFKTNIFLVQKYREYNAKGIIIVIASTGEEAHALYAEGATYVIMPKYLSAKYASSMIMRLGFNTRKFELEKEKHIEHITEK